MNRSKKRIRIDKLCLSAMFLAIGYILPIFTGQIPQFGNMLCPMHIPALLSGFVLGPIYGLIIGFILPLTRSLFFSMPRIYPTAFCMAFELAAYGFISGLIFNVLNKKKIKLIISIILSLIISMLSGRIIWGIVYSICGLFPNCTFTLNIFLTGAFITAWPGIILQIILIPIILLSLSKTGLLNRFWKRKYE